MRLEASVHYIPPTSLLPTYEVTGVVASVLIGFIWFRFGVRTFTYNCERSSTIWVLNELVCLPFEYVYIHTHMYLCDFSIVPLISWNARVHGLCADRSLEHISIYGFYVSLISVSSKILVFARIARLNFCSFSFFLFLSFSLSIFFLSNLNCKHYRLNSR